ncbi:MAG: FecR domain-containing protein [Oligoflexia bacterium]|nr:FecR domain-containing protein [Oligoflexia bacterium]
MIKSRSYTLAFFLTLILLLNIDIPSVAAMTTSPPTMTADSLVKMTVAARATKISGNVTKLHLGLRIATEVKIDDVFYKDTSIVTQENSYLKMKYEDGTQVIVGPKSKIVITEFFNSISGEGDSILIKKKNILSLLNGSVRVKVQKSQDDKSDQSGQEKFSIKTKSAAISAMGTEFQVFFNNQNGITSLITYEGNVAIVKFNEFEDKDIDITDSKIEMSQALHSDKVRIVKAGHYSAVSENIKITTIPIKISSNEFEVLSTLESDENKLLSMAEELNKDSLAHMLTLVDLTSEEHNDKNIRDKYGRIVKSAYDTKNKENKEKEVKKEKIITSSEINNKFQISYGTLGQKLQVKNVNGVDSKKTYNSDLGYKVKLLYENKLSTGCKWFITGGIKGIQFASPKNFIFNQGKEIFLYGNLGMKFLATNKLKINTGATYEEDVFINQVTELKVKNVPRPKLDAGIEFELYKNEFFSFYSELELRYIFRTHYQTIIYKEGYGSNVNFRFNIVSDVKTGITTNINWSYDQQKTSLYTEVVRNQFDIGIGYYVLL